jgi:hypothetical protein
MPVGGSDFGHLPPAGTTVDLSNKWIDGTYTFRSGSTMVSTDPGSVQLQGINGSGNAPTVAAGAGAGVGATITLQKGHDLGGSFTLTAAGTPAAGVDATVTFGTALPAAPASIIVQVQNNTANAPVTTVYLTSISATGFSISNTAALTASSVYVVNYQVVVS